MKHGIIRRPFAQARSRLTFHVKHTHHPGAGDGRRRFAHRPASPAWHRARAAGHAVFHVKRRSALGARGPAGPPGVSRETSRSSTLARRRAARHRGRRAGCWAAPDAHVSENPSSAGAGPGVARGRGRSGRVGSMSLPTVSARVFHVKQWLGSRGLLCGRCVHARLAQREDLPGRGGRETRGDPRPPRG